MIAYTSYNSSKQKEDFNKTLLNFGIKEIIFQFDQDIINPSSYEQAAETWQTKLGLKFDPPLSGSIRTINSSSFVYTIHTPISPNESISITASNITSRIHDKTLRLEINGHFVNELPYTLPAKQFQILYAQRIQKDLKSPLILHANIPINLKKLKKLLVISENSKKIPYQLHYQQTTNILIQSNFISTNFQNIIVTMKSLKPNRKYQITVSNHSTVNFQDEFSTYSPVVWQGISSDPFIFSQDFTVDKEIWLHSSNPLIDSQNKSSILQISPPVSDANYVISNNSIRITGTFKGNTSYTITFIANNIKDIYKQKLTNTFTTNILIKHITPEIKYPSGIILLNKNKPIIPIEIVNISNLEIKFQVIRSDYYIARTLQNHDVVVPVQTSNIMFNIVPDEIHKIDFNLDTLTNNHSGLIQLSFHNTDLKHSSPVLKAILSSSLLTAYISFNNLVFYARDMETQEPLADMMIMIYDKERGSYQDLGKTGTDGFLRTPKPNLSLTLLEEPLFIGILNNDITFAGYGSTFKNSFTHPYYYTARIFDGDISYPLTIKNLVFTDKPSYNPGETVNIHAIARLNDRDLSTRGDFFKSNIIVSILDPEQKELTNITKKWTEFGSFNISYTLERSIQTGNYSIIAKNRAKFPIFYAETDFKVDTANSNLIDLPMQFNTNTYYYGDLLNFSITAVDFLNTPVDIPITYKATITTKPYFSSVYPDYIFNSYDFKPQTEVLIKSIKNKEITFSKKLKQFPKHNANLTITAIAHPTNSIAVTNTTNNISVLLPLQLGLKAQHSHLPVLKTNTFHMLALYTSNQQVASNIDARFSIEHQNVEFSNNQNFLQKVLFFFLPKSKIIYNKKIKLGNNKIEFTPTQPGTYIANLKVKYEENNIHSSVMFEVHETQQIGSIIKDNLMMYLDKPKYNSGEKAVLSVINPYPQSRLLLFLERKNTIETRSIESTGEIISAEIPLTIEDEPSITIIALLFSLRPQNTEPVYSGRLNLIINPRHQELQIKLNMEKQKYTPGEKVRLELNAVNYANIGIDGEAVIIVRDKSIPSLNTIPNPLNTFYNQKPFSFSLWDSGFFQNNAQSIARPYDLRLATNIPIEDHIRSNIQYTAFYQGNVRLYHNKKTIVEFNLPDNITSFDITVLGYDKNSLFGKTNTAIYVSRPMTSDLLAPKFVRIGDRPIWGSTVKNNTTEILDTQVILKNPYTNYSSNITLLPKSEKQVVIQTLIESNQSHTWTVQGLNNKYQDGFMRKIPVIKENPWETASYSGLFSNSTTVNVNLDTNNLLRQQLTIQVSPSPLLTIKPLVTKIITNESLYLSDIVQRIFLISSNEQLLYSLGLTDLLPVELKNIVIQDIRNLNNYIISNKINSIPTSMFIPISEYMVLRTYHTLINAQKSGYAIDFILLKHLKNYIDEYAQKKSNPRLSPYLQTIYQLYAWKLQILDKSLSKDNFISLINHIITDNAQINALILDSMNILGLPLAQIKTQVEKVNEKMIKTASTSIFSTNRFENNSIAVTMINNTTSQYDALKILNGTDTNIINSIDSYLLYAHKFANYKQNFTDYKAFFNRKPITFQKNSAIVPIDNKNITARLDFETDKTPYFYSINYQRIPIKSKDFVNQGFNIEKTIYDENQKKITDNTLRIGKTYTIVIDITPNAIRDQYICIIDPLYAGLQATSNFYQLTSLYSINPQNTAVYLFARTQNQNKLQLRYSVVPIIRGTWTAPATQVFDKENPEIFSYKKQSTISIINN